MTSGTAWAEPTTQPQPQLVVAAPQLQLVVAAANRGDDDHPSNTCQSLAGFRPFRHNKMVSCFCLRGVMIQLHLHFAASCMKLESSSNFMHLLEQHWRPRLRSSFLMMVMAFGGKCWSRRDRLPAAVYFKRNFTGLKTTSKVGVCAAILDVGTKSCIASDGKDCKDCLPLLEQRRYLSLSQFLCCGEKGGVCQWTSRSMNVEH